METVTSESGYHHVGFCQAGFSAALTKEGDSVVLGAPGSYYWQGQVYSLDLSEDESYRSRERNYTFDDTYQGYSVAVGEFDGHAGRDYAVGVPRDDVLKGSVVFYTQDVQFIANITGEQLGEYFGYALAVADFNGDGLHDIAVGAPFHTDYSSDAFETGCVYVDYQYANQHQHYFAPTERRKIVGNKRMRIRFGMSLVSLGDINMDGYYDLAVSAPYDGTDQGGAIYIFHGSEDGLRTKVSQIIYAEDVSPGIKSFGCSVSGGYDMDGNIYPDILVGAYESDQAVLLRSRPIVRVETDLRFEPNIFHLDKKQCTLLDGTPVTCTKLVTCLTYRGVKLPAQIQLSVSWRLDSLKSPAKSRIFYIGGSEKELEDSAVMSLIFGQPSCHESVVYMKNDVKDKLTAILALMNYTLIDPVPLPADPAPILDQYIPTSHTAKSDIQKNCGGDDICIPNMRLKAESLLGEYVIGTGADIDIVVTCMNDGEDSFGSQVLIKLPDGVDFNKMTKLQAENVEVRCTLSDTNLKLVTCDVGNPLPAGNTVKFALRLSPAGVNGSSEYLQFPYISNPENVTDLEDNHASVDIPVTVIAEIRLTGVSKPEQILYNSSGMISDMEDEIDIGPEVVHLYEIRNLGPSSISSVSLEVYWPEKLLDGADMLYVTTVPKIIQGEGHCRMTQVNSYNITILPKVASVSEEIAAKLESRRRIKREVQESETKIECQYGTKWCTIIECETGRMDRDDSVLVQIWSRLWINTILDSRIRSLFVVSEGVAQVMKVPYQIRPQSYNLDTFQVDTYIALLGLPPERKPVPFWVIALSIFGGAILLMLVVLLCYLCGFFKRKKPEDMKKLTNKNKTNGSSIANHYDSIPTEEY